jgi:hypothetical protein
MGPWHSLHMNGKQSRTIRLTVSPHSFFRQVIRILEDICVDMTTSDGRLVVAIRDFGDGFDIFRLVSSMRRTDRRPGRPAVSWERLSPWRCTRRRHVGSKLRKNPRVSGYAKALLVGQMTPGYIRDLSRSGCQVAFMQSIAAAGPTSDPAPRSVSAFFAGWVRAAYHDAR